MSENQFSFDRAGTASFVGCAIQTVDRWLNRECNPLPAIRTRRRVIILKDSLVAWLHAEELRQQEGRFDG